jgi:deoxyribodipyrimidine photo-lyase
LKNLIAELGIDAIFTNKDYTPYAISREMEMVKIAERAKIHHELFSDYYLFEPGTILSGQGKNAHAYKKYTPFYFSTIGKTGLIEKPVSKKILNFAKTPTKMSITLKYAFSKFTKNNPEILVHGGRKIALDRLKLACREQKKYDEKRDFFVNNTTFLSAYIKFGCVSIREVFYAFKETFGIRHGLIRELFWREFFAHVLFAYPEVVGQSYQPRYRNIKWHKSAANFEKWKEGKTGFPIVDACMRQLNETGYMHNRGRMTVASFLIKTLFIDWRLGEKYFAQKLTDYDLASNNGNWQGISGTGVDMKPYFRDMNPWIQQLKFDENAEFIKKWVPELADVSPRDLHKWDSMCTDPKYKDIKYNKPMVDYYEQKIKMIDLYINV